MPKVSIIILNWNGLNDTTECLESLKKITYSNYDVIVVDNNSSDNDIDILKKKFASYIHLVCNDKNYGFAEGNNIGIRYAIDKLNPQYIMLLNNDTIVDPHFLDELTTFAESNPDIGILGPKLYLYDEPNKFWMAGDCEINWWTGTIKRRGDYEEDSGQYDKEMTGNLVSGAAMFARRSAMERLSLLDKAFFFAYDDADICLRAHKLGIQTAYVPASKIWHKSPRTKKHAHRTEEKAETFLKYQMTGRIKFFKRHASLLQQICQMIVFLVTTTPRYVYIFMRYYRSRKLLRILLKQCKIWVKE